MKQVKEIVEEKTNGIVEVIQSAKIEKGTAEMLQESFNPFFKKAKEWETQARTIKVTDASQKDLMTRAREIRLELQAVRTNADKKRISLKEDSLRYGKAVQGVYNVIEFLIVPIEKHLLEQEKFAERQEQQRQLAIKEKRQEECLPYSEYIPLGFDFGVSEEDYQKFLKGFKLQLKLKEDEIKAEERAAREKAELKRIEDQKIQAENEKLKAERAAREKELALERAENEKKRMAIEAIAAKEKAAREKAEKEKKDAEEKIRKEKEAEEKKKKEIAAAEVESQRKAQNAPDREKIVKFISDLSLISYPEVKRDEAKKIIEFARLEIGKLSAQLSNKISQI